MEFKRLQGKTALITGASAGLGRATALSFARAGADVVMVARGQEKLDRAAHEVREHGTSVLALAADVGQPSQVEKLAQTMLHELGRVDILVNNAAIDYSGPITALTIEQWNEVLDVNLSGVFYLCKAVFPAMIKQQSGYIINISSVAGKKGWPNATAYCATKFALTGFTQALSGEGQPHNIRCSVVYPGGMDTEWHAQPDPANLMDPTAVAGFLLHMVTQNSRLVVNEAIVSPLNEAGYP